MSARSEPAGGACAPQEAEASAALLLCFVKKGGLTAARVLALWKTPQTPCATRLCALRMSLMYEMAVGVIRVICR